MYPQLLPLEDANPVIPHDWKSLPGGGGHNGEYVYRCTRCGARDWIASYGTLAQLNSQPCRPGW